MSDKALFRRRDSWEVISAEKLAKEYPHGLNINLGLIVCPGCNQPLSLVCSEKKIPYFRHSADDNKDCQFRADVYESFFTHLLEPGSRLFPLVLNYQNQKLQFHLGLFRVASDALAREFDFHLETHYHDGNKEHVRYRSSRLFSNGLTYLPIGAKPPKVIKVLSSQIRLTRWPKERLGISLQGSLFDTKSGKMLPNDATVIVDREYWLLIPPKILEKNPYRNAVSIKPLPLFDSKWNLYVCKAKKLDDSSIRFFRFYSARLTDTPTRLTPFWPIAKKAPYELHTSGNELYLAVEKNLTAKIYPERHHQTLNDDVLGLFSSTRIHGLTTDLDPVISVGRHSVVKFVQLVRHTEKDIGFAPSIKITDLHGNEIENCSFVKSLERDTINVHSSAHTTFKILKEGLLVRTGSIHAYTPTQVIIGKGEVFDLYLGLDKIYSITRKEVPKKEPIKAQPIFNAINDEDEKIPFVCPPLSKLGSLTFEDKAKLTCWAKQGQIPVKGYYLLLKYLN